MTLRRTQRLRDSVHGLIVFRDDDPLDQLAWSLINTSEFQRLRRIKQLGVSEFVFPGATHTRLAHSIGVFHVARNLVNVIEREIGKEFDRKRANVAVIAALLHDLGHGPFSHTFEGVRKAQGIRKKHEEWTAEIILNEEGNIRPILAEFGEGGSFGLEVANLLRSEDPTDIYHAVVSSSFDADRLDYLRRDRLMTGTGAGAIDFDWLLEHVRVRNISLAADEVEIGAVDSEGEPTVKTFCIDAKAQPAAEAFLLARYALHEQVYFHKTTRCIEHMIAALLKAVLECEEKTEARIGLSPDHPIARFFSSNGATIGNYLALDDVVVMGAFERMTLASEPMIRDLASRLRDRRLFKTLDLRAFGPDAGRQRQNARRIDRTLLETRPSGSVLKDVGASLSIYSQIGGDDEKAHKKLRILDADGLAREITEVSDLIKTLATPRNLVRYYFAEVSDRDSARNSKQGTQK